MARDVDDVVGAAHDEQVAVLVLEAGVRGLVVAGELAEVAFLEALVLLPQRRQACGRQRQLDHDRAHGVGGEFAAGLVDDAHVVARHRHGRRAMLHRQHPEPHRVAGDAPAGFGLPPVIDHRLFQMLLGPLHGRRVGAFAGKKQRTEAREIVAADVLSRRVFLLDRAERGRRGEQRHRLVLGDDAPERARVRRADRLALVEDRGAAAEQRRIDDVGVADHPADVGGAPPGLALLDAVEAVHRPGERDHVAAVVAHHAFRNAGRAGGVEDVERVGRQHRHARRALARLARGIAQARPIVVAAGSERGFALRPLEDDAGLRFCFCQIDR